MGRTEKFRGSRTHGHGMKARRGAGKRGGKGKAGAWKHRKMWIRRVYGPNYAGKYGFKRHPSIRRTWKIINVGEVADRWGKPGETVEIDLSEAGYDKLLGTGNVSVPLVITVAEASPKAIEKIEAAGGEVRLDEEEFVEMPAEDEPADDE